MAFNGKEGEFFPLKEAAAMTSAYRQKKISLTNAVFYGKDNLKELLEQDGAMGLRIYFAESKGEMNLVVVAANYEEEDITEKILEFGLPCPPICRDSALNK